MTQKEKDAEWHLIGNQLSEYLNICNCQRKLKTIIDILLHIRQVCGDTEWEKLTKEELFITALLDNIGFTHGSNAEYPIVDDSYPIWDFIDSIKDSPALEDN
jgi:hypothetical protein